MVRIELNVQLKYEVSAPGADFIFNIHPALTSCQRVVAENLQLSPDVPLTLDAELGAADGRLDLSRLRVFHFFGGLFS